MSDETDTESLAPVERVIAERYVLYTEIGRGGMGIVWRAEDRVIGRPVAVKEVRLTEGVTPAERAEFEQRILREARTAGRLNDPAVVTVYDVVHDNGSVFIVMELVEAPTLSQVVRASGPLPPHAVADLGRQVLSALEAAHGAGIVHRDVKPSNIMVGETGRAKLTDFGIAQAADDPTLTKTGNVIGSPAYLAPERLSGQEASPASDLWSLGAVLYFATEGRSAFERETTAATLGAVLNEIPYLTNVQGPLAAAISGMLTPASEGRLTASQVRNLLDAVGSDGTVRTLQQSTMVMPVAGVPATAFGGPGTAGSGSGGSGGIVLPAPRRRSRARVAGAFAAAVLVTAAAVGFAGYSVGLTSGKDAAHKADARPSDAVTVYTLGGPGADFPSLPIGSGQTCLSGPPFTPGQTYQDAECKSAHDVELYYQTAVIDSSYSQFGADGNGPIPYPGVAELAALGRQLCWTDRLIGPWADPAGSDYDYYALIPSENLWNGKNLPANESANQNIYCVMTDSAGQLPGDG